MNPEIVPVLKQGLAGLPLWALGVAYLVWALVVFLGSPLLFRAALHLTRKTASDLDDRIIGAARGPVRIVLLLVGLGIGLEASQLPEHFVHYARSTVFAAIALAIIVFADRVTKIAVAEFLPRIGSKEGEGGPATGGTKLVSGFARGLVIGIGLLIVLDTLGVSITPLLGTLGVGSLAVALALQDTLGQFFAGIYVTMDKPLRVGDFVRLSSGEEGRVLEVGWRSTRMHMTNNSLVIVPNSKLASASITNFDMPSPATIIQVPVCVAYDSNLAHVEAVAIEVARTVLHESRGGDPAFEPTVRFLEFADSGIQLNVGLQVVSYTEFVAVRSEFIWMLHERFGREGIVIPYPVRDVRIGGEGTSRVRTSGGAPPGSPSPDPPAPREAPDSPAR